MIQLRRLFLILMFLLGGFFHSANVLAVNYSNTNYDFTQTFDVNGTNETLKGTFSTTTQAGGTSSYLISGWSNVSLTIGGTVYNASPSTVTTPGWGAANMGSYNPTNTFFYNSTGSGGSASMYFNVPGTTAYNPSGSSYWQFNGSTIAGYNMDSLYGCSTSACSSGASFNKIGDPTITVNSSGAPEIDGSLAPKVGFLLGCLFLMFGRKKQNSESMLTA